MATELPTIFKQLIYAVKTMLYKAFLHFAVKLCNILLEDIA